MPLLESCQYLVYKHESLCALITEMRCVLLTSIACSVALWQQHMQTACTLHFVLICSAQDAPGKCLVIILVVQETARCFFYGLRNKTHNVSVGFSALSISIAKSCATVAKAVEHALPAQFKARNLTCSNQAAHVTTSCMDFHRVRKFEVCGLFEVVGRRV